MQKKIVPFLFLLISIVSYSQNVVQVNFDEPAYDERYFKSKLVIPVFRFTSPELEEYEKFGAPGKKGLDKFTIKKLPDMAGCDDTAYGFIYYTGYPAAINRGYVTMLIGNHRRWMKPAILYIDRNNNLDFTDDGPADTMQYTMPSIKITMPNTNAQGANYNVVLSRFDIEKDRKYETLMDDFYRRNQGNKVFAGLTYSFKENRQNMRGATYQGEADTFRIALMDGNFDGLYNNAEFDRVYVAKAGDSIFLDDFVFSFQDGLKDAEFEWNYKVYRITELDPAGRFIKFYWDKDAQTKRALQVGKKLPKFSFYLDDAKTTKKIKKYRRKGLYIYFYNTENPTFEEDTAALRQLQTRFGNCINVVTLNYGDYYRNVSYMRQHDNIPYTLGLSNRKLNRQFNIEKLPTGFLCHKGLRLSHKNISPQEVLQLLEKGMKKE
jgi:hypothetical protein